MESNETTWSIFDMESTTMTTNIITAPRRHVTFASQIILTLVYICGVIGNISALLILFFRDKRRNRKHLLMLRCLAINDLVALLGMLVQMYGTIYGGWSGTKTTCSLRIVWRLFGLFSGCVAIVMAVERWLALTRPFVYQKRVTYPVIVRCMVGLWLTALTLTILPIFGFGIYYESGKCKRYREATEPEDIAYAYVWFSFGTLLCVSIVFCNLAVSNALRALGRRNGSLRRVSRSSAKSPPHRIHQLSSLVDDSSQVGSTVEERAFAKLMTVLSFSFVICWMPQMISIPLAQYNIGLPTSAIVTKKGIIIFQIIADIFLCIHFTLDPYFYVLFRRQTMPLLKPICRFCRSANSPGSSFNGTSDHHMSSGGDPPTPVTEVPSSLLSESTETHTLMVL
ncbi:hypothetical protein HCN44_011353 [Aphidius gifuensis]|uniref:G-protein coupled receptors family 1 profile domain-containing protein n=1 Tax=Aphidius gifuensis TaxID=684658 RepID=A0A835CSL5_APHGI|nr:prostaglandin E2 receptor EP3 subtype [Aphidius gifuensis]KAF7994084.1 hypothetical protein HCN44_011353 [Aphidius gifuensis]